MNNRTLFWQFFGTHTLILISAVSFITLYAWLASREVFHNQWIRELETQARIVAALIPMKGDVIDEEVLTQFMRQCCPGGERRFTLMLPDGKVIGDSSADASRMDRHSDRPEVVEALEKGIGMRERYSASIGKQMLYLALRVPADGPAKVVVRVSAPLRTLTRELAESNRVLMVLLVIVVVATLTLSYGTALRIIGPVSDLKTGLARIGGGDLSYRLPIPAVPHLADLTRSINHTAGQLQKYLQAVDEERNLRTLILANMTRGVIAIDTRHVIMDLNGSARRLLQLHSPVSEGARIGEVTRFPELLSLIDASEKRDEPVEAEMSVGNGEEVQINLRATALQDMAGQRIGTLVVLSDVTLLRRLETVRQDFVANVSHELRTPITAVKGFAETLLDGAMNDPATAERFLKIIARQAGQLESIICDLLDLSRLEQNAVQTVERQVTPVAGILKNAIELCQVRAAERGVALSVSCEQGLTAVLHAGLMEQAVINLVDNAIKYGTTAEKPHVDVDARREAGGIRITVRDYGSGIEHKHLDRLFERFYRVDKGRSRELGGTGLGLAIVKHIALIHGGTAGVESELGRGSTFSIRLPA